MKIEQRKVKVREIVGANRDWFIEDVALGSVKAMEIKSLTFVLNINESSYTRNHNNRQ